MKVSKALFVAAMVVSTGFISYAEDNRPVNGLPASSQTLAKLDSKTAGAGVRASKLIGMKIYNANNEHVGTVKDLVVDPLTSHIQYMAVSYGGFLGMGDKWFAVPTEAIHYTADPSNLGQVRLQLDVTKEKMQGAQGFDEQHWPNFSDSIFTSELYKRYGVERRTPHDRLRDGNVDVNVGRNGVNIEVDRNKK